MKVKVKVIYIEIKIISNFLYIHLFNYSNSLLFLSVMLNEIVDKGREF